MHQNLKTTFSLDLENEWQTIASSKAYGTFYTLHAKFKYKTGTKTPESCDLYIQNFSGFITLGIDAVSTDIILMHDPLMGKPSYVMHISLKALHANDTITNHTINLIDDLDDNTIVDEFSKDYGLKIEVLYEKIPGFNEDNLRTSTAVDMSYQRDGESLLKKTFSEPLNETSKIELYKNYFNSNERVVIIEESAIDKRTDPNRMLIEDTFDRVQLSTGETHKVVKPYPCYLSYVQFV